jgi:hypothetical protein
MKEILNEFREDELKMKYYCEGCKKETIIRILPDYCSSSLWCHECGCEIDIQDLNMPNYLTLLITHWNLMWDILRTYKTRLNMSYMNKLYNETGEEIAEKLSKQYECYFDSKYEAF